LGADHLSRAQWNYETDEIQQKRQPIEQTAAQPANERISVNFKEKS
jgi:hypothetical protein